jgi:cytochrome c oxidase subunit 3
MEPSGESNPYQFSGKVGMWLFMITITLLFGALSMAYMTTSQRPVDFTIPWGFYANTGILLLSSVVLHVGWVRRHRAGQGLILRPAVLLGLLFLVSQVFAWYQLYAHGMDISHSGQKVSFLYLLTGLHAAHLIGGILFLVYVWATYPRKGQQYLESAVFFWHFLGILWVYLLCVLVANA